MTKLKFSLLCLLLILLLQSCTYYFLRDSSQYELNKEQLNFLKTKKFGLVGFYAFDFAIGTKGIYETEEPHFPCSYYNTLKEIDRDLAVYDCIVEFINEGKKDSNLELYKKIFRKIPGGKNSASYSIPAFIDDEDSTIKFFPVGNEIEKFKDTANNDSIPEENLRKFLLTFLSSVRHSGLKELESILNIQYSKVGETCSCSKEEKSSQKITSIKLKQMNIDYWIIANHKKLFSGYFDRGSFTSEPNIKVLTWFPALFTLATFPYWDEAAFESKFYIYDKKLNLIKTLEYKNTYDHLTAWWMFASNDKEASFLNQKAAKNFLSFYIYEPDIKELTKEIFTMVKK